MRATPEVEDLDMLEVLMVARQHLQLQVHVHVQRVQHLLDVHV